MSDVAELEQRVRAGLQRRAADLAAAPPSWGAVEPRLRRARRRRIVVVSATAAVLVLVAGGLGVAALGLGAKEPPAIPAATRPAGTVVPWVATPAPKPTPVTNGSSSSSPPSPPCSARQLSVRVLAAGYGLGNQNEPLILTNVSHASCALAGRPGVVGVTPAGAHVRLVRPARKGTGTYFGEPGAPGVLAPGAKGELYVTTSQGCDNGTSIGADIRELFIEMPDGGGTFHVRSHTPFDICGLAVSDFGVLAAHAAAPDPFSRLLFVLHAPATVQTGALLGFSVSVHNPTSRPISLVPCPSYEEYLTSSGYSVQGRYQLNCATVHEIGPGKTVSYELRLYLPPGAPTSPVGKLGWLLFGRDGNTWGAARGVELRS